MPTSPTSAPVDVCVGLFGDVHGWGGGRSAAAGVAAECRQRGLCTGLIGVTAAHEHSTAGGDDAGINVFVPPRPVLWRFQSWRVAGLLGRQLRRVERPRVGFVAVSPFWVIAARRAWPGVPVVYLFPCLLSNCLPFTWPELRRPGLWVRTELTGIRRAEHLAFEFADRVVTATREGHDEVLAFHPRARGRVTHCYFGCTPFEISDELRRDRRHALGVNDAAFVVLAAGVCDRNKAFDRAVREWPAVQDCGHLVVVGDGPERERLQGLALELGVVDRVHFAGPQSDMAPWYAAADSVISTSFYDTFPNVILEAMRCGRPVVVPQHDPPHVYAGVAETIRAHGGGLIYDRLRDGTLAECLNALSADRSKATGLGQQASNVATRLFRWDGLVDHLLAEVNGAGRDRSHGGVATCVGGSV